MFILVSLIVPCYQVEKYLSRCIDSIINQTYSNLDIILVDDGSKDSSGKICDEYANKDCRIRVIHKQNGGLSDARNIGIESARGDYICFVDSDDWLRVDSIEKMVTAAINCDSDIVVSNYYFFYEKSNKYIKAFKMKERIHTFSSRDGLVDLFYQRNMETGAWGKLYKRELWKDLRFPLGRLFEDIPTIYKAYFLSNKIVCISKPLYYYRIRDTSIMGTAFNNKKMDAVYCAKIMFDDVLSRTNDVGLINAARCRYVSMCFNTIFQTRPKSNEEKYIWNEITFNRANVIKDRRARKKTVAALILSFCGIKFLRLIYKSKR